LKLIKKLSLTTKLNTAISNYESVKLICKDLLCHIFAPLQGLQCRQKEERFQEQEEGLKGWSLKENT
jgi:hypothetical protein